MNQAAVEPKLRMLAPRAEGGAPAGTADVALPMSRNLRAELLNPATITPWPNPAVTRGTIHLHDSLRLKQRIGGGFMLTLNPLAAGANLRTEQGCVRGRVEMRIARRPPLLRCLDHCLSKSLAGFFNPEER